MKSTLFSCFFLIVFQLKLERTLQRRSTYFKIIVGKKGIGMRRERMRQQQRKRRIKRKTRKKVKFRFYFFLLLCLILLGFSIYGIYQFIRRAFLVDNPDKLPTIRTLSHEKITEELVPLSTQGRNLSKKEKEEDLKQLLSLIDQLPTENHTIVEEGINKYKEKAIQSEDDGLFFTALKELMETLKNPDSRILTKIDYLSYRKKVGQELYTKDSPYAKAIENPRTIDRYQRSKASIKENPLPELEQKKNSNKAIISNLSFQEEDFQRDLEILKKLSKKIQGVDHIVFDLRGSKGKSQSYWSNFLPYFVHTNGKMERTVLIPSHFDPFLDFLSRKEKALGFDLQDDRNFLLEGDYTFLKERKNLSSKKKLTLSAISQEIGHNRRIDVWVDQNTGYGAETFAYFILQEGLGQVLGKKTMGKAFHLPPALYSLKHSGYLVSLDFSFALNEEENNIIQPIIPKEDISE